MPSKPVRTLEEREAAYAEARLRILGSAVSNDEEVVDDGCDNRFVSFMRVYGNSLYTFVKLATFSRWFSGYNHGS